MNQNFYARFTKVRETLIFFFILACVLLTHKEPQREFLKQLICM